MEEDQPYFILIIPPQPSFFKLCLIKWIERPLKHQRERMRKNTFLPAGWLGFIRLPAPGAVDN